MSTILPRTRHLRRVLALLERHPVVGMLGARQVGKTTLAREVSGQFRGPTRRFDLEDSHDLAFVRAVAAREVVLEQGRVVADRRVVG
ncbi:MAG: hypothetical protein A2083_04680 [Gemmatimonadetes bacterium GWC2_71_9]|nr:MAG: hypothetical protein A2083_04680 [Gemmatimonadetes bacterium GWC2_71_9]